MLDRLLNAYLGGKVPVFDFAGGTVVHISSGFSTLVTALYIGKRVGYPQEKFVPHSLTLSHFDKLLRSSDFPLFLVNSVIVAVGAALPFSPLAGMLGFTPLPLLYWPLLAAMLVP